MTKKIFRVAIFFSFLIIASCKKSDKVFEKLNLLEQSQLETHNQQVNAWKKMFQVNEQIKTNTLKLIKTIYSKGQFITSFQVGEQGTALYFISEKNKFNSYGIKTELKNGKVNGLVEIFDFQKMDKRGLRFSAGKLTSILTYPKEQHFNNNNQSNSSNQTNSNQLGRTSSLISGIRKFFCELFGGYWDDSIAGNATNSGGSCTTTSNGEGQVESILNSDGGGGGFNWGPIYTNINNPSFFDYNSSFWQSYLNTGGGGSGTSSNTYQIPQLTFEQKRDFLITTLNLDMNQQFFLINTDGIIEKVFELLVTSGATNKIDISMYTINYISTVLNLNSESIEYLKRHLIKPISDDNYLNYITAHMQTPTNGQMWWEDENWMTSNDNAITNTGIGYLDPSLGGGGITQKTKDHILKGEIKNGVPSGCHAYNAITSGKARWKPGTTPTSGPGGCKQGQIQLKIGNTNSYTTKSKFSTFFPDTWDDAKVLAEIGIAYASRVRLQNPPQTATPNYDHWEGIASNGMKIMFILTDIKDRDSEVITAYPIY